MIENPEKASPFGLVSLQGMTKDKHTTIARNAALSQHGNSLNMYSKLQLTGKQDTLLTQPGSGRVQD